MTDNISIYEEYLFATDKTAFIESCKQSSDIKRFIRICHILNHPEMQLDKDDMDEIDLWKRQTHQADKGNLVFKHQLTSILNEGDAGKRAILMAEFNDRYLGYRFDDSRQTGGNAATRDEATGQKQALKTSLTEADHQEMNLDLKIEEMVTSVDGHSRYRPYHFDQHALTKIDLARVVSMTTREDLFNTLTSFVYSKVCNFNIEHRTGIARIPAVSERIKSTLVLGYTFELSGKADFSSIG